MKPGWQLRLGGSCLYLLICIVHLGVRLRLGYDIVVSFLFITLDALKWYAGTCLQTLSICPISISSEGSGKRGDLKKVKVNGDISIKDGARSLFCSKRYILFS